MSAACSRRRLTRPSSALRERIVQRNEGLERALQRLTEDPEGEGIWLHAFVEQFFREELLDNPAGAVYILQALERRDVPSVPAGKIGDVLVRLAPPRSPTCCAPRRSSRSNRELRTPHDVPKPSISTSSRGPSTQPLADRADARARDSPQGARAARRDRRAHQRRAGQTRAQRARRRTRARAPGRGAGAARSLRAFAQARDRQTVARAPRRRRARTREAVPQRARRKHRTGRHRRRRRARALARRVHRLQHERADAAARRRGSREVARAGDLARAAGDAKRRCPG